MMDSPELKNFISVESYDEKTVENYWNCYVAEKRVDSKLSKISIPNFSNKNWRLEWRLYKISQPHLLYVPRNKTSKSVTVGPSRVGMVHCFKWFSYVLLKWSWKFISVFFRYFLNVLELFECCQSDPCMTHNSNYVRFTQSEWHSVYMSQWEIYTIKATIHYMQLFASTVGENQ